MFFHRPMCINLVKGWAVALSEKMVPPHPIMVWEKRSVSMQKREGGCEKYDPIETELFYDLLSTICSKLRNRSDAFRNCCLCQDTNAVNCIYEIMDQVASKERKLEEVKSPLKIKNPNGHCSDNEVEIHLRNNKEGLLYFEYQCPCLGLTEMIFPIMCEGITIAVVVTGQVIKDKEALEKLKKLVADKYPELSKGIVWDEIEADNAEFNVDTILDQIKVLEGEYYQQLKGERRKIMNITLDNLSDKFLSKLHYESTNAEDVIFINIKRIKEAKQFLKEEMGIDEIFVYLDERNLNAIVNKDGEFIKNFDANADENSIDSKKQKWYRALNEVGDLFEREKSPMIPDEERPDYIFEDGEKKDKWSIFVMLSAPKDEPIVLGIKYKGKKRFLREEHHSDTLFEKYLLPKFAMFVQNTLFRVEAQRRSIEMDDNRKRLSHEVGQVGVGVRALNIGFSNHLDSIDRRYRLNELKGRYSADEDLLEKQVNNYSKHKVLDRINEEKNNYISALEKAQEEFVTRANFFKKDMEGQFEVIELLSKIIVDNAEPKPKSFDLWSEFFNKWNIIFKTQYSVKNNYFDIPFGSEKSSRKNISTDPVFLQSALYNIVNNAIKYSYDHTAVSVDFFEEQGAMPYVFKIKNYGMYLDPKEHSIYEKGVRIPAKKRRGEFANDYVVKGEGLGLYWSKAVVKKLGGDIYHDCKIVSEYNVPLLELFFEHYSRHALFREMWDKQKKLGFIPEELKELSYDDMMDEHNELMKPDANGNCSYTKVNRAWKDEKKKKISALRIFTDVSMPTYEVTFTIKIPRLEWEGK